MHHSGPASGQKTLHSSKRDRGLVVGQANVTNAFIGKTGGAMLTYGLV